MAHKDANHSSTERTILWTIIPVAVALTLLFTSLNNRTELPRTSLPADLSAVKKKEMPVSAPATHAADTTHAPADTTHHEAPAEHAH
jgi:hypothetical protein